MELVTSFCLLLLFAVVTADTDPQNQTFYNSGVFTSPNYPDAYDGATYNNYSYFLVANNTDDAMVVMFHDFKLIPTDCVRIEDSAGRLLGRTCGEMAREFGVSVVKSSKMKNLSITVHFDFEKNAQGLATGFNASFNTLSKGDLVGPTEFHGVQAVITSPGWPANFPAAQSTVDYTIQTPRSEGNVKLTFTQLSLGTLDRGNKVEISLGQNFTSAWKTLDSTAYIPEDGFHTDSRAVVVRFTSTDSTPTSRGFRLKYEQYCIDKKIWMTCDEADWQKVKHTLVIVFGSIGILIAVVVLVVFLRWYIKRSQPSDHERAFLIQ